MRKTLLSAVLFVLITSQLCSQEILLSRKLLQDKIKGGWAGQTIGVTFGGPYEFRYQGTFIGDYQSLLWYDGYLKKSMLEIPGLYDDLYMDLTFVDVFEKYGLNAPVDSFANAFAKAGYMLWHANQAGRYNILNGIPAPSSGQWKNNPHADCIDYQIEADFAGLMSPGMPNTSAAIGDKIGHIMNYGDGWYGGVYVGAMYSLAFTYKDIRLIVKDALKTIPPKSDFYACINDVINWHKQYPADWKQTWLEVQKKWADDTGCPEGVFLPFNIDAKVNAAYVVIGLLYGNGDFTKTLEISTRCGQDADCNPSSAGGILGALIGYDKIPPYWKQGLTEAENIKFKYTSMSLNDAYAISLKHALENIRIKGGKVNDDNVMIRMEKPVAVRFEKSFEGVYPAVTENVKWNTSKDEAGFEFSGTGFVIRGDASAYDSKSDYVFQAELYIDGIKESIIQLPVSYTTRRYELAWKYDLPDGKHTVKLKILNPSSEHKVRVDNALIYTSKPTYGVKANEAAEKSFIGNLK